MTLFVAGLCVGCFYSSIVQAYHQGRHLGMNVTPLMFGALVEGVLGLFMLYLTGWLK